MPLGLLEHFSIPVTVGLAIVAAMGYLFARFRRSRRRFTLFDALQVIFLMVVVTGTVAPSLQAANRMAKETTLLHNLRTLRTQIALYKLQHGGDPPMLYENSLPQLFEATNAAGVPGVPGNKFPCGPYLAPGIIVNPVTGQTAVTPTDAFPPKAASGRGGWLFHQPTGQIVPDLTNMLDR